MEKPARGGLIDAVVKRRSNLKLWHRPDVVGLQPRHRVGTVRSAAYSAKSTGAHLLDVDCGLRHRNKRSAGRFVLRSYTASERHKAAIDKVIDAIVAWRSPKHLRLEVDENPKLLAELITEWTSEADAD